MIDMSRYNWLEAQLNKEDLSDDLYSKYNNELNALQDQINEEKRAKKEREHLILVRILELRKEGRTEQLVEEYGSQFRDDYIVDDIKFTVTSLCFNHRNRNGTNFWQLTSKEETLQKVVMLIYWRVYNHYFRNIEDEEKFTGKYEVV